MVDGVTIGDFPCMSVFACHSPDAGNKSKTAKNAQTITASSRFWRFDEFPCKRTNPRPIETRASITNKTDHICPFIKAITPKIINTITVQAKADLGRTNLLIKLPNKFISSYKYSIGRLTYATKRGLNQQISSGFCFKSIAASGK